MSVWLDDACSELLLKHQFETGTSLQQRQNRRMTQPGDLINDELAARARHLRRLALRGNATRMARCTSTKWSCVARTQAGVSDAVGREQARKACLLETLVAPRRGPVRRPEDPTSGGFSFPALRDETSPALAPHTIS